ncbi:4622_t:CDS:2 [Entrophospora sp. SA101]|nr:4622_t:CDS:2 [Entrophospora sp. SA101]
MEQFYIKWRWCSRYYNSVKGLKKGINQLTIVTPIHDQYWSGNTDGHTLLTSTYNQQ